jgi:hypothetical protein
VRLGITRFRSPTQNDSAIVGDEFCKENAAKPTQW